MKKNALIVLLSFFAFFILANACSSKSESFNYTDGLNESFFISPSKDNYPETWYHFIGGNVSKEGITADLEAIAASGISGIQLFHGQFGGKWPGVENQIQTLSPLWDDLVLWVAQECKRLDLHFTMQNCPGWSYAGGPWIEPENAMRHLVYSRTDVESGQNIKIQLEKPQPSQEEWRNYQDLFVVAFPTPEGDSGEKLIPIEASSTRSDMKWMDFFLTPYSLTLPPSGNEPLSIDVKFKENIFLRTVEFPSVQSFSHAWCYVPGIKVSIYANTVEQGKQKVASLEMPASNWQDDKPITIACREVLTDKFTIEIENAHAMNLSFINFYSAARQQNWESEAAWTLRRIVREDFPEQSPEAWLKSSEVIDISNQMDSNGLLSWQVPDKNWTILRIGHVNTGMKNGPAPAEATGWESNKLSKSGIRANFDGYIGRLVNEDGILKDNLLQGMLIDSWECKTQTWTRGLDTVFYEKWNYPMLSMLPALFGYVVDEPERTSRFLRDWRVNINDLLVENFFGEVHKLAHEKGLKVSFETASGDVFPGDILEYYKYADIPMCEFWQPYMDSFVGNAEFKPVRPCVSAARMYGKKRIATEAFTSFNLTWDEHPQFLKDYVDSHFAKGITHTVFHTFTHNPRIDFLPPSTSLGNSIGTPFLRLQTWWQHMPSFTQYLARSNYMLEEGIPVSDVLMYLGDEQNHKPGQTIPFPNGYAYDYCNPDVLLNRLTVKDGELITPEGLRYRVLWLHDCKRMLPETLEKILTFVEKGLILVGNAPDYIATLSGGIQAEERFRKAVERLWGDKTSKRRIVGKGKVYRGEELQAVLTDEHIKPDIISTVSDLRWLHRTTGKSDFYYISMSPDKGYDGKMSFHSQGIAELWNPLTGEISAVETKTNKDGYSELELNLPAGNTCFVVFRKEKSKNRQPVVSHLVSREKPIDATWQISFPTGWGIEAPIITNELKAWKDMPFSNEGKSFSGTAQYTTTFSVDKKEIRSKYILDLGQVKVIAKVRLNGKEVGTCWCPPYVLDVSEYLAEGENKLEIQVTSTWFNRLVYDADLPEKERKTWTISGPKADLPLKEYGLFGPVVINYE